MGSIAFALSIHHFISSVGSDAGFASIIGLAILILLYFAQARETSTLRKGAEEAGERIAQLEARLGQVIRGESASAQPQQAQAAAQTAGAQQGRVAAPAFAAGTAPVASRAFAPAAPAGVGAPALAAATKLIPTPTPTPTPVGSPPQAPAPQAAPVPVAVGAPVAEPAVASAPAPATVAGGANGGAPRPVSAGSGGPREPGIARRPVGVGAPRRPSAVPGGGLSTRPSQSRVPRVLLFALGALGVVAVVVVLLLVTAGGSSSSSSSGTAASNALRARRSARANTVNPASVTVVVLNGTATNGLAARTAQRLAGVGYSHVSHANAPDQTHTATIVAYLAGFKRDALAVATSLKLPQSDVRPVDPSTQAVACPGSGACNANVVVTVGADLANS